MIEVELGNLNEKAGILSRKIADAKNEIAKEVIGQQEMIEKIIIGTVTGGHILLEGVPGLAKSRTVSAVANVIGAEFKRIQFTPDLLPADLIGTDTIVKPFKAIILIPNVDSNGTLTPDSGAVSLATSILLPWINSTDSPVVSILG